MEHLIRPNLSSSVTVAITPQSARWNCLSFMIINLRAGQSHFFDTGENEMALVPLEGKGALIVSGERFEVGRKSVFSELPHILYVPPGHRVDVESEGGFEFAIGGAPAEGKYPVRLFQPADIKTEIRGGGAARRQVNHSLAYPMPAERLILYEVYVPGGSWSGWPPHCHDGYGGSPYLDEVYYFRIDPEDGLAVHRNYRIDNDFDETFSACHGDVILITQGFHTTAAAPGSNVYFLNYLAGDLFDDDRKTPPYDDPAHVWIKGNWDGNMMELPVIT